VTGSTQQPKAGWSEVGRQFEELGRALRSHFGHAEEPAAGPEPGGAGPGGGTAGDKAAVRDALRRLGDAAQRLGDQAGDAVRDPTVRATAQRAAYTFRDALETTFSGLGVELRGRMRTRRGSEPADTGTPPPTKEIGGSAESAPER
jgi:hypothetical protein